MRCVAANMVLLVACPAFWLWHALGALLYIPAFLCACSSDDPGTGAYAGLFILPVWSAYMLTSLQKDLLVSPLGFCLPGQRAVLRRTSLLVGITMSLVAALPVLTHPGFDGMSQMWAVWSAFCFGLSAYLLVVGSMFLVDAASTSLTLGFVAGISLLGFELPRLLLQQAALFAPGWNTVILAALASIMWRRMGSVNLARRICGGRFLSLQMVWRLGASEEHRAGRHREYLSKSTWHMRRWLLRKGFARIARRPALSFRRYLAATQYELASRLLPLKPWTVPLVVLAALVFLLVIGYAPLRESRQGMPNATEANLVYNLGCVLGVYLPIPMFATMLLPAGRRERFLNALTITLTGGAVVLVISLLMYVLLLGMGSLAPPLSMGGAALRFRPADLGPAFVPLATLPAMFLLKLACKKWFLVPLILFLFLNYLVLAKADAGLRSMSPSAILVLVSASWAILAGVLYRYSFHRDLVRE